MVGHHYVQLDGSEGRLERPSHGALGKDSPKWTRAITISQPTQTSMLMERTECHGTEPMNSD